MKQECLQERVRFRRNRTTRNLPYPEHLDPLPEFPTDRWLDAAISDAKRSGEAISEEEVELALGCDWNYKKYGALWSHGRHFRVQRIDHQRTTFDCGVLVNFIQNSRASARDDNTMLGQIDYCGTIQEILKISFRKFDYFIFDVKWFKVVTTGRNATVRRDKSGLIQVDSTKLWTNEKDTFVLPEHCEQVVFSPDPKDPRWLFVVQVAPRSRQVCEGLQVVEEQQVEEEQGTEVVDEALETTIHDEADDEPETHAEEDAEEASDEDVEGYLEIALILEDEDVNMHIEIDRFGASDLVEDDRLDDNNS